MILECVFGWLLTNKINSNKTEFRKKHKNTPIHKYLLKCKSCDSSICDWTKHLCLHSLILCVNFFLGEHKKLLWIDHKRTWTWRREKNDVRLALSGDECAMWAKEAGWRRKCVEMSLAVSVAAVVVVWVCIVGSHLLSICSYLAYFHYCLVP